MELIKHRVTHYWSHRAGGFETQRLREFESEKKGRWLAEFARYLPQGRPLRILDVGTGTGFFACLLAEQGHETTGIDLTPEMIDHAEHMAAVLGVDVSFTIMDAEEPEFEAESFDVLVTRNLTWTLPHIEKAYREWFRILKPGGVLINFDADYSAALENEEDVELPENHAHKLVPDYMRAENDAITMEVGAYHGPRPQWDVQLLVEAGFESVTVDMGVYKRIYREIDEFFNPTPIFTIAAYKA
jgi:ubiquinone/menaquinone biosynthesis C-methylase UbiE